jgi:Helix-turn-helix domain
VAAEHPPGVDALQASNGRSVTSPDGNPAMPDDDPVVRLMEQGRRLNSDDFVRMLEGDGATRASDMVSINDLAVELGVSIRTLRRWNKHPDAPKRYRRGRRLMYRRADVRAWFQGSEKTSRVGDDARDERTA